MTDGWKFAESLLGVAAEALKARREAQEEIAGRLNSALGVGVSSIDVEGTLRAVERALRQQDAPFGDAQALVEDKIKEVVAERLCSIVCPDRRAPADMAWVEQKVRWLVKFQQDHATPDAVRDAALEEAAKVFDERACTSRDPSGARHSAAVIRALKSKPATDDTSYRAPPASDVAKQPYAPCLSSEFGKGSCLAPVGHTGEHRYQETGLVPQPSGNSGELDAETRDTIDSGGGFSHLSGATTQAEPLHDFGWALQQMRAGKKVRRAKESGGIAIHEEVHLLPTDMTATDWQVVE